MHVTRDCEIILWEKTQTEEERQKLAAFLSTIMSHANDAMEKALIANSNRFSLSFKFSKSILLHTCAAKRVLTRSNGYVADAAVSPARPPATKCTPRSTLVFPL